MTRWTLACERCGSEMEATALRWCCDCGAPLRWAGERVMVVDDIIATEPSLWRYASVLPLGKDEAISLGEVMTPLVPLRLAGGGSVLAKLDYLLPSGSYKDRGAAVMLSALKQLGMTRAIEDSSGNAAAAISAYAARGDLSCAVYAPAAASAGKLVQASAFGAEVHRIEGSRDDVADAAMRAAAAEPGAAYASHNWHPFFIEGVKTWALECWEQLGYVAPDNVIVPAGSGSMVWGAWLAFHELLRGGEIERIPRIFAAQPAACAPLAAALEQGASETVPFPRQPTIAEGTSIANPVRGWLLLQAIRGSGGMALGVSEEEIRSGLLTASHQGIYPEPTSAVAVAAAERLLASGTIGSGETTVMVLSGNGLKATETIGKLLAS